MAERAGATAPDAALPEEPSRWHRAIRAWRHESEEIERVGDRIADPETRATIRRLGQSYLDRSEAAFADAAQSSDFVSDLAWLALDFERVGAGRQAAIVLSRYRELAVSSYPLSLLDFYVGYHAIVRARLSVMRRGARRPDDLEVRRMVEIAVKHLRRAARDAAPA